MGVVCQIEGKFMAFDLQPYCGIAPQPEHLLSAWNLDPILIGAILGFGLLTWPSARANHAYWQWCTVMLLAVTAFVSPLCALSSALFTARAFHHILLISAAAPLSCWLLGSVKNPFNRLPTIVIFVFHTSMLWLWHLPGPYAFALSGSLAYWLMEIPLLLSAALLWQKILDRGTPAGEAILVATATTFQMTALGAFLTLAGRPLFSPHFLTTDIYGFSPLEDQQLAGLLMWIPASLPYVAAVLYRIGTAISGSAHGVLNDRPLNNRATTL
jgi:putative membrane protein